MKLVMRCTVSDCSKTSTLQSEQPIADYVEDLQFSTLREGAAVRTSSTPTWGTGKIGWFKPTSTKADCADVYPALGSKSGKVEFLLDDDMSTSWTCKLGSPKKKHEYGYGKMNVEKLNVNNFFVKSIKDKKSQITIDGIKLEKNINNIIPIIYEKKINLLN